MAYIIFIGSYYRCTQVENMELIKTKWDCMDYGGSWVNYTFNFDNILQAMVYLYLLASTEGWIQMMWYGLDSVAIDT